MDLVQKSTHIFDDVAFSSEFDSGNLVSIDRIDDCTFDLWIGADCGGTEYETKSRIWFHFKTSVDAAQTPKTLTFTIRNLNHRGRMYRENYVPFYKVGAIGSWRRVQSNIVHEKSVLVKACH
jgi:hypothetical protein